MKDYARIATKIRTTPWLCTQEGLTVILGIFNEHRQGHTLTPEQIQLKLQYAKLENNGRSGVEDSNAPQVVNGVGILPLMGPIFGKANLMTQMSGATSLDMFQQDFRTLMESPQVNSILLQIDSPGGSSEMVQEMADEIFAARSSKPIYAIADSMSGSAAYYLGSQATAVYATPSGSVGSIGVYTVHEDRSGADAQDGLKYTYVSAGAHKTEGNPHEPLSTDAQTHLQEQVDEIYGQFLSAVARGRNTSTEVVRDSMGGGRMFSATKALDANMIDGIVPFEQLVNTLSTQPKQFSVTMPAAAARAMAQNIFATNTTNITGFVLDFDGGTVTRMESKEWEHSEPGTGSPPAPRKDEDGSDDPAITGGWRRDPLPIAKDQPGAPQATNNGGEGSTYMNDELYAKLGLSADADEAAVSAAITALNAKATELDALKSATSSASEAQRFKEQFPEAYAQHQAMLEENRDTKASAFASSVSRFKKPTDNGQFKDTDKGLSSLAKETVALTHKKFAMGLGTLEDFETAVKAVVEGGVVDFGEVGSNLETEIPAIDASGSAAGVANNRKLFAAKIAEIRAEDSGEMTMEAAMKIAAQKYPDLAAAYLAAAPA